MGFDNESYAYPIIGKIAVSDIVTEDVLRVLKPIWKTKLETADRVRGRIEKILHAAKAANLRTGDNPAVWKNHLSHPLPAKKKREDEESHHPAMPYAELPAFVRDLAKRDGIAPKALEMLILTVARTDSLIGMQDRELDLRIAHTWTIPGSRMKGGKELRLLGESHGSTGLRPWLFLCQRLVRLGRMGHGYLRALDPGHPARRSSVCRHTKGPLQVGTVGPSVHQTFPFLLCSYGPDGTGLF